MKARLHFLVFTALLLLSGQAMAQSKVIYDQKRHESVAISSIDNQTLARMAEELEMPSNRRTRLLLPIEFEQQERITKSGGQITLSVQVRNVRVRDRVPYRGFDMAQAFDPSVMSAKVQLLGREDKVLQTITVASKDINRDGSAELVQATIQDTSAFEGYKLRVIDRNLDFSARNRNAVSERIGLVKEYYEMDNRLAQLSRELQAINPNDIDYLAQHKDRLISLQANLDRLERKNLDRELDLNQNDPIQLRRKMKDLAYQFKERALALDQMYARLPEIFYSRGLELAMNGNVRGGRDFFMRSIQANPAFAPSHLQLARLDLKEGYVKEAGQRTRDILNGMQPDPETYRFAQELALDIQNDYVREGERLNNQGKYREALQEFEDAREFCRSISSLRCRPELWDRGIAQAKNGIYDNYLKAGQQALAQKQLGQAEKIARDAQAFAQQNKTAIGDDVDARNLMREVQQQYYANFMADGRKALQAKQFSNALTAFEKAKDKALDYQLKEQADAVSLTRQAAKPVLLAKIGVAEQQALGNLLAQARTAAGEVSAMQVKYGLVNDKDLDVKFRGLSQRIFSQECQNAQSAYDQYYRTALQLSSEKKFYLAANALEEAIASARENGGCAISSATADVELTRIDAPARYQEMLIQVDALVSKGQMAEAVQTYLQAGQQYQDADLARFGLVHAQLVNFGVQHANKTFIAEVTKYAAANAEPVAAIDLLKRLIVLDYSGYNLNKLQELVGEQLATRDAQANPKANYKAMAETYTAGNKDLKKLNKAYQKKFKKLT
ncbi:hypothetical protein GU926_15520 [Nibribacter ruber]|uniref:Tetratricopeptide repeat protein n=1 Tax=Nibribacter ruber TaxID=2698458 RepID=A0A6P1P2Z8_9BACT|nr:hypothetical protein [Nibribacter ruber]QHL88760.1 hypothetical protein GU926_15520 [Nibribacter ruber]